MKISSRGKFTAFKKNPRKSGEKGGNLNYVKFFLRIRQP